MLLMLPLPVTALQHDLPSLTVGLSSSTVSVLAAAPRSMP